MLNGFSAPESIVTGPDQVDAGLPVDSTALSTIRAIRARKDPIMVIAPSRSDCHVGTRPPPRPVIEERLNAIPDITTAHPRQSATWGETAFHLQESSLVDSTFTRSPQLALCCIRAFNRLTAELNISDAALPVSVSEFEEGPGDALGSMPELSGADQSTFTIADVEPLLEDIRRLVMGYQHHWFVTHLYESLPTALADAVPRQFWVHKSGETSEAGPTESNTPENAGGSNQAELSTFD